MKTHWQHQSDCFEHKHPVFVIDQLNLAWIMKISCLLFCISFTPNTVNIQVSQCYKDPGSNGMSSLIVACDLRCMLNNSLFLHFSSVLYRLNPKKKKKDKKLFYLVHLLLLVSFHVSLSSVLFFRSYKSSSGVNNRKTELFLKEHEHLRR